MQVIIDNWAVVLVFIMVLANFIIDCKAFFGKPGTEQLEDVKEWLLWAVMQSEKHLGGGTGTLKLREVYDMFLTKFPWLAKMISFEQFADLVDEALEEMKGLLKSNAEIFQYINSDKQ